MYSKEAFDKTSQQRFDGHRGGCNGNFRSRFAEAFSGGFKGAPWAEGVRRRMAGHKSVNISETTEDYILSLYAAGLKKELFSISLNGDVLTISYQPENDGVSSSLIYEEYQPVAFKRSFQLNGKVLTEQIAAVYIDGVLSVTLPKDPEAHQPDQTITVN